MDFPIWESGINTADVMAAVTAAGEAGSELGTPSEEHANHNIAGSHGGACILQMRLLAVMDN
eukprot:5379407-Amphidinium_carterae.1